MHIYLIFSLHSQSYSYIKSKKKQSNFTSQEEKIKIQNNTIMI
jgi:hypothetical protein